MKNKTKNKLLQVFLLLSLASCEARTFYCSKVVAVGLQDVSGYARVVLQNGRSPVVSYPLIGVCVCGHGNDWDYIDVRGICSPVQE